MWLLQIYLEFRWFICSNSMFNPSLSFSHPYLLLSSISSTSHFSNRPVRSVGERRMSFTFRKNSCETRRKQNSRLFKKKHRQTSRIIPNYLSQHHLHSWTSRTGRLTPSCWRSSPGCLSRNASRKPGGADELQDDAKTTTVKLATTTDELLSFDGVFLAFIALV